MTRNIIEGFDTAKALIAKLTLVTSICIISACQADKSVQQESASETAVTNIAQVYSYGEDWGIHSFWPGEYPMGFTVLYEGDAALLRTQMHPDAPKVKECWFQQGTAYHPWNNNPIYDGEWDFFSVTQKVMLTVETAFTAYVDYHEGTSLSKDHRFKPGDTLTYLNYVGEGYSLFELHGQDVLIHEGDIGDHVTWPAKNAETGQLAETHLWMSVTCGGGDRAFVWLRELKDDPSYHLGVSPFVSQYGMANDLTAEQIAALRDEKSARP